MNTSMIQANGENKIWGYDIAYRPSESTASDAAVTAVERIISEEEKPAGMEDKMIEHPLIRQCCEELQEYFAGCRQPFDVRWLRQVLPSSSAYGMPYARFRMARPGPMAKLPKWQEIPRQAGP